MFIGHFGVAYSLKKLSPSSSLGTLFAAVQLPDLLWPIFILMGWESVKVAPGITEVMPFDFIYYPWSHSLIMVAMWATYFAIGLFLKNRSLRESSVVWVAVVSHWILDWITHRPDLELYPSSGKFGIGLWDSLVGTLVVEGTLFALGVWLYMRSTRATDGVGSKGAWAIVLFLAAIYIGNIFGPPPPENETVIAMVGISQLLFIGLVYWTDRHRVQINSR